MARDLNSAQDKQRQNKHRRDKAMTQRTQGQTGYIRHADRSEELINRTGNVSIESEAGRLGEPRLQEAQQQTLATRIGQTQGNRHLQRLVQRQAEETESSGMLIVEDDAETLQAGQMRKREFLTQLERAVCATADEVLTGTLYSTVGCPYITSMFSQLPGRPASYIERMIRLYAPETGGASAAADYIDPITSRVRSGVAAWLESGEVTGAPAGLTGFGGSSGTEGAGGLVNRRADDAVQRTVDPRQIQNRLGEGQPLDGSVRSQMEAGLGHALGDVTVHTDSTAAQLAQEQDARAFTVGRDIVFGSGEYRPGTPVGDAIIAHEMAHVVQQKDATEAPRPIQTAAGYDMLEEEANVSALGTVTSLWGGMKTITRQAVPQLRSGLRLQRCKSKKDRWKDKSSEEALQDIKSLAESLETTANNIEAVGESGEALGMARELNNVADSLIKSAEEFEKVLGEEPGEFLGEAGEVTDKIDKLLKSAQLVSSLLDDEATRAFMEDWENPKKARAWAEHTTDTFTKAADLIPDDIPGLPIVPEMLKGYLSAPANFVNAYLEIQEGYINRIDSIIEEAERGSVVDYRGVHPPR